MSEQAEAEVGEIVRRVANNQRIVVLLMAIGLLAFWLAAVSLGFSETAGRWLVRQVGQVASPENSNLYMAIGATALVLSALFWLFSGQGNRAFEISSAGIVQYRLGGSTHYPWSAFGSLERNVGAITLNLANPEPGFMSSKSVVFNLAALDWNSTEIEALIVYHRPDLFSAASQFGHGRVQEAAA